MTTPLDKRICPGCGRRCGAHSCRRCDFASNTPIPTTRELLDAGTDYRECSGVDLGAFARALARDVRAAEARGNVELLKDPAAMRVEVARLVDEFAARGEDFVGLAMALRPHVAEWMAGRGATAASSHTYLVGADVVSASTGDVVYVLREGSEGR